MDRSVVTELHRLLDAGRGGLIASQTDLDRAALIRVAEAYGAHFAELDGPTSKPELLRCLREALRLPHYTGSNWDALEEVLAYPEPTDTGTRPAVLGWCYPERLPAGD